MAQALHDGQLVFTHRRRNQVEQGTGDQIEQGDELPDRQLVSPVLRGLATQGLQLLGVRHREGQSVNTPDAVTTPEPDPIRQLR
jgi:hypothetical protein